MNLFDPSQRARTRCMIADEKDEPISNVLVPVDLSGSTLEVLRYARTFAKRFDAAIHVLHVVQLNIAGGERTRLIAGLADRARVELLKLIERFWNSDLMCSIAVREGRADATIVEEAHRVKATMIIMGTRNRPWVLRLILPDTLGYVIRNAPCPVVAVQIAGMRNRAIFPAQRSKAASPREGIGYQLREARI